MASKKTTNTKRAHSTTQIRTSRILDNRPTKRSEKCFPAFSPNSLAAFTTRRLTFSLFRPLFFCFIFIYYTIRIARIDNTNTVTITIVALNRDFSRPRRSVFNSPDPPKPAPSEAPRCCNRINKIDKIADTKTVTFKNTPISIDIFYTRRPHIDKKDC